MSTVASFLILYLIPVLTFLGTVGCYMFAYGKSVDHSIIDFSLVLVVSGFIASSYITFTLISKFIAAEIIYWGISFSILGWLLGLIPVALYLIIFKDILDR